MTTVNNRKVSLPPRKDERVTRNVPPPSGKSEDPKLKGFFDRPRKGGKSFWDWLDLIAKLAIPIVVLLATIGFGWWQVHLADLQHQSDQQSALDQQRAVILQTYIDNIQDLLLNQKLAEAPPLNTGTDTPTDVQVLARARTLTALRGLDPHRKGILLKFIYEAKLIGSAKYILHQMYGRISFPVIDLRGADLTNADLRGASLPGANLSFVDLRGADLDYANLSLADLTAADLSDARNLTQEQLDQVDSCNDATLPLGLTCHSNQPGGS